MTAVRWQPILVGRSAEVAALLRRGNPTVRVAGGPVTLLLGGAGSGRSRLLAELVDHIEGVPARPDHAVLTLRAGWLGASGGALGPLVHRLVAVQAILRPHERAAVARLRDLDEMTPVRVPALAEALAEVVSAVAARRPLLIALDDLHLAGATALRVLRLAAARCATDPWRLIMSARDQWPELADETAAELGGAQTIALPALEPNDISALASQALGCVADNSLVQALRDALGPLAGLPGAVLDSCAALRADGALVVVGGTGYRRHGATPIRLEQDSAQISRLGALPGPWPDLLALLVALGGVPADALDIVAADPAVGIADVGAAVDGLCRAGLVTEVDGYLSPTCPALTTAVNGGTAAAARRVACRLLERLECPGRDGQIGPEPSPEVLARVADLVVIARPASLPDDLAEAILRVARECLQYQPQRVAVWCEVLAGGLSVGASLHRDALDCWSAASAAAGDWRSCRLAAEALLRVSDDDPGRQAGAYLRLTWAQYEAGEVDAVQATLAHARTVLPVSAVEAVERQQARIHLAACELTEASASVDELGRSSGSDSAWAVFATMLVSALRGELDRYDHFVSRAAPHASTAARAEALESLAFADFRSVEHALLRRPLAPGGVLKAYQETRTGFVTGRWDSALHAAAEIAALPLSGSTRATAGLVRAVAAEIAAQRGEAEAAEDWLHVVDDEQPFGHVVSWARAGVLLGHGDAAGAQRVLDRALNVARRRGVVLGQDLLLSRAVDAARELGEPVADRLDALAAHARRIPAAHVRLRWLIAAAPDDKRAGRAARALARKLQQPFDAAVAAVCAAGTGLRSGRSLLSAYETFTDLGATAWQRRCEALLQDIDLPLPAPAAEASAVFTVRERQVGDLVAHGLNNRQIARSLGLGEKTVEGYLTRLLRKSGARSRVQLGVSWERGDAS